MSQAALLRGANARVMERNSLTLGAGLERKTEGSEKGFGGRKLWIDALTSAKEQKEYSNGKSGTCIIAGLHYLLLREEEGPRN